jgi:undecaprenyl phosphate N,N'-diacetylbacillosamine 1-phosphate transferase
MKEYLVVKRILDLIFALILLIIIAPILLIVLVAIKTETKGPVFFKQDRLGLNGKIFKMYKFRSMVINAEKTGTGVYSYRGDPRVTKVGAFIRKTSIDELPQLINIIKGEMSVIGPRPTLTYHPWKLEDYEKDHKVRFNIRPGVTGLAQINGRKELSWPERIVLDVQYIDNINIVLDIKIFLKTVVKIISMGNNYNTSNTVDITNLKENKLNM